MKYFLLSTLFALLLGGCNFDPAAAPPTYCVADSDCRAGRICVDSACTDDPNAPVDGGTPDGATNNGSGDCTVDRDGDGFRFGPGCAAAELDCDDNDDQIHPGAATRCNGKDNDCDGAVDTRGCECTDGLTAACGTDAGECRRGTRVCDGGGWTSCDGGQPPVSEACDGLDNDCDGTIDEGCPCDPGETKACGTDEGVCASGTQTCVQGTWSDCQGESAPGEETCNGLDDDCDGVVDNDPSDAAAPCQAPAQGACAAGSLTCEGGQLECTSTTAPQQEICNNLDDDCDGEVDEAVTQSCMSACGAGTQTCEAGAFGSCTPTSPPAEICNGRDDDCDGITDETFPESGMSCDSGEPGVCAAGTYQCASSALVCVRTTQPSVEVCDGIDNDCDRLIDEDDNGLVLSEACGGVTCPARAVRFCFNGSWSTCDRREAEICNGIDSNCDSVPDNQATCYAACPGGGFASGTLDCGSDTCELPDEICGDGLDNDCDGVVDGPNCDTSLEDMVHIPGGTFVMGSTAMSAYAGVDEIPRHIVELDPFYIDRFEVSRADYASCIYARRCSLLRQGCPLQLSDQQKPAVCITWSQANDYCRWAGKRLPTEAEWEKAARGPFPRAVDWPWGNTEDPVRGVFSCGNSATQCTSNVDSYPTGRSYFGLHHMAGNAAEWVADYYRSDFYTASYTINPYNGSPSTSGHTIRGGGYEQDIEFGRVANRAVIEFMSDDNVGFRCAR